MTLSLVLNSWKVVVHRGLLRVFVTCTLLEYILNFQFLMLPRMLGIEFNVFGSSV